jgi:hypothetical protein
MCIAFVIIALHPRCGLVTGGNVSYLKQLKQSGKRATTPAMKLEGILFESKIRN